MSIGIIEEKMYAVMVGIGYTVNRQWLVNYVLVYKPKPITLLRVLEYPEIQAHLRQEGVDGVSFEIRRVNDMELDN